MSESERLRLARMARDAALTVPGVAGTDGGPLGVIGTSAGPERISGVTCTPGAGGGYDVVLRLVCTLSPLPALGDRVHAAVLRSAAGASLPVAKLTVHVADITDDAEIAG